MKSRRKEKTAGDEQHDSADRKAQLFALYRLDDPRIRDNMEYLHDEKCILCTFCKKKILKTKKRFEKFELINHLKCDQIKNIRKRVRGKYKNDENEKKEWQETLKHCNYGINPSKNSKIGQLAAHHNLNSDGIRREIFANTPDGYPPIIPSSCYLNVWLSKGTKNNGHDPIFDGFDLSEYNSLIKFNLSQKFEHLSQMQRLIDHTLYNAEFCVIVKENEYDFWIKSIKKSALDKAFGVEVPSYIMRYRPAVLVEVGEAMMVLSATNIGVGFCNPMEMKADIEGNRMIHVEEEGMNQIQVEFYSKNNLQISDIKIILKTDKAKDKQPMVLFDGDKYRNNQYVNDDEHESKSMDTSNNGNDNFMKDNRGSNGLPSHHQVTNHYYNELAIDANRVNINGHLNHELFANTSCVSPEYTQSHNQYANSYQFPRCCTNQQYTVSDPVVQYNNLQPSTPELFAYCDEITDAVFPFEINSIPREAICDPTERIGCFQATQYIQMPQFSNLFMDDMQSTNAHIDDDDNSYREFQSMNGFNNLQNGIHRADTLQKDRRNALVSRTNAHIAVMRKNWETNNHSIYNHYQ